MSEFDSKQGKNNYLVRDTEIKMQFSGSEFYQSQQYKYLYLCFVDYLKVFNEISNRYLFGRQSNLNLY